VLSLKWIVCGGRQNMPRSSDPIEAWAADIVDNRTSKAKKQALTPFRRKLYAVLKKVPRGTCLVLRMLAFG